jgi:cardiolipin synthase
LSAIEEADNTIDFLTFVYWEGDIGREFAQALADRAQHGVRVRVLLDALGSHPIERSLVGVLEEAGVAVRWFRPLHRLHPTQVDHRTHRKVMIVDEATAFTGGVGIADVWLGNAGNEHQWRDTHFRIQGPAVDGLRAAFLDNWLETDPELFDEVVDRFPDQPKPGRSVVQCVRGASETGRSDIHTLFRTLLQVAEHRVRIATAYFVPGEEIMRRITHAAERGVLIDLLLPGPHADKRFVQLAGEDTYAALLDAGVNVWNFQPSMLHAKIMTVDGMIANVGSANLNARSTALDEEINVVAIDPVLTRVLDRQFDDDLDRSIRLEPGRWQHRSAAQRAIEAAVRPFKRSF